MVENITAELKIAFGIIRENYNLAKKNNPLYGIHVHI